MLSRPTFVLLLLLFTSSLRAQNSCPETFFHVIGNDTEERGYGFCDAPDGNLYAYGLRADSALIIKMAPDGAIIWARTFDFYPDQPDHLSEIFTDSDGRIVGCGNAAELPTSPAFVFRYDPDQDQVEWVLKSADFAQTYGVLEKEPGGNYIAYCNPVGQGENSIKLVEVDRTNGTLIPGFQKKYNHIVSDFYKSMIVYNGALYGTGRITDGNDFGTMRTVLSRFDLNGNEQFTRLGHIPPQEQARLYGMDLIEDDGALYTLSSGDDDGPFITFTDVFFQKNSPDGDLLWLKKFVISGFDNAFAAEVISLPDGFVLYGWNRTGAANYFVIKTDKDGNLEWAKKIDYSDNDVFGLFEAQHGQIHFAHNHLYGAGMVYNFGEDSDMLFFKMDLDGNVAGNCGYVEDIFVDVENINNAVQYLIDLEESLDVQPFEVSGLEPQAANLSIQNVCRTYLTYTDTTNICPSDSVYVNGAWYIAPTTIADTTLVEIGCDTIRVTKILPGTLAEKDSLISFCPGESVEIGGIIYSQPDTVEEILNNPLGCDTLIRYTLELLPNPEISVAVEFCPGDTVWLQGQPFTQEGVYDLTIPASSGCDTLARYSLLFKDLPTVTLDCPADITVEVDATGVIPPVNFDDPVPGLSNYVIEQLTGLESGEVFPVGTTENCFVATDECNNSASCCFEVEVIQTAEPCDVKENGCVRFELIQIFQHSDFSKTYQVRVINNCNQPMKYVAWQVPSGIQAVQPADNSIFTAMSSRTYEVRNPSFTPFNSVRFKTIGSGIANGEGDIFEYTLPPQADPDYILARVKLGTSTYVDAHLNTFFCPVVPYGDRNRVSDYLRIFPNPSTGSFTVESNLLLDENTRLKIFDLNGRLMVESQAPGNSLRLELNQTGKLPYGLYILELISEGMHIQKQLLIQD